MSMKILIPGGHLTPALGLIDWIQSQKTEDEVVFAGRIYSQSRHQQKAIEAYEVTKRNIEFIPLSAVKFGKENPISLLIKSFKFWKSIIQAFRIVSRVEPDVLMSFGGYVALPAAIACKLKRIPILTHEGTRVVGMANKIIFQLADKVAYTYEDLVNFDLNKLNKSVVRTGTPLRQAILNYDNASPPSWLEDYQEQPLLLILGGNQGSLALNEFIKKNLDRLTKDFVVVHQCGRPNKIANYPQELSKTAAQLGVPDVRYYPLPWIDEEDLVCLYQQAQLALSRAGANTLEELIYLELPSILVPLPHAHFNEQLKNAQHAAEASGAVLLPQSQLNWENFESAAADISRNRDKYVSGLKQLKKSRIKNSSAKIYQELQQLVVRI